MHDRRTHQAAQLKEWGLSSYGSRVYLALLDAGTADARLLGEAARIPAAKIYATLDQLERRGFVVSIPGRPRRYSPVPAADLIDRRVEEQHEATEELVRRRAEIISLFPLNAAEEAPTTAPVLCVRGGRNVAERFREGVASASWSLTLAGPPLLDARVPALDAILQAAVGRGVRVKRVEPPESPLGSDVLFAGFDGHVALLARLDVAAPGREQARDLAVLVRDPTLAAALTALVETACASGFERHRGEREAQAVLQR